MLSNGWCRMRWLKGVVMKTNDLSVQIELETGRRFWATPNFKLQIMEQVVVSWDYTRNTVRHLTTNERLAQEESEEDKTELAKSEGFPIPMGEEFEGSVEDLAELTDNIIMPNEDTLAIMDSEERSFPIPLGEDVDRDDVVLLRDDIHIY